MTNQELTRKILLRINKMKLLILFGGVVFAVALFLFAKSKPTIYTAKSSLFPLTSGPDKNSTNSKLAELIGAGGNTKSLTDDANVNIEEVAKSKKTRIGVVSEKVASLQNKSVAQLLVEQSNQYRIPFTEEIKLPKNDSDLYSIGAELIKTDYTAKFNKNSLLEITFTSKNPELLQPVTYIITNKISEFYKELKIKKAKVDFEFLQAKVDSFNRVLRTYDRQSINMDNTTLFVHPSKLKFTIPKENLENEKILVTVQRNSAVYNREEALLRLEKITPIIEILDKPTPPYDVQKSSKLIYSIIGFVFGCLFVIFFLVIGLLFKYTNTKVQKTISEKLAEPLAV